MKESVSKKGVQTEGCENLQNNAYITVKKVGAGKMFLSLLCSQRHFLIKNTVKTVIF